MDLNKRELEFLIRVLALARQDILEKRHPSDQDVQNVLEDITTLEAKAIKAKNEMVGMIDLSQIKTEQRTGDWIAWYRCRVIWEADKNEAEAVGKLILRLKR